LALTFERAAILGATGAMGIHLAAALARAGVAVRAVSRSRANLERAFPAAPDLVEADLRLPDDVRRAAEGCDLVVVTPGVPLAAIDDHRIVAHSLAGAVGGTGARIVHVSSFWAYLPLTREVLDETHPREGGPALVRARREAEDVLAEAGAVVVNLPDLYGPHVASSIVQNALRDALAGRPVSWIGRADTPREHAFVPDAAATILRLAAEEGAYGARWIVPGSGPLTGSELVRIAATRLGRGLRLRAAGPLLLRLAALVDDELKAFSPLIRDYTRPLSFNAARLRALLGEVPVTPHATAIPATLDALADTGQGGT
jgi:nucleoside-diphosphate-sugar epimerase